MTLIPLTAEEIREWAIARINPLEFPSSHDPYNDCLEDLIMYIDNEPKLREIMNERTS